MPELDDPPRILVIGAHPDDCDVKVGGTAVLWRMRGFAVRFVSVTDGRSGHHRIPPDELIAIRRAEAEAAGRVLDVEYRVLDFPDGGLEPTLEARLALIREIRAFRPQLVVTHRPNDYHPDHRYTAQLVCDAAYMVTVPAVAPDVPALRENPVFAYMSDRFARPYPFSADVAVDIHPVIETVVDALDCHRSQFYEWLPYNHGCEAEVPDDPQARRDWLGRQFRGRIAPLAERVRPSLIETYGSVHGRGVRYAEAFEISEYGSPLTPELRRRLFPFLPSIRRPHPSPNAR